MNLRNGQLEHELEFESEWEGFSAPERAINPVRRWYHDALMEHFGQAAATAGTAAEAEAFVGALVPLALRAAPRVAPALLRHAPRLVSAAARLGRTMLRRPAGRRLLQTLPTIVRSTVRQLAGQVARGRTPTPAMVTRQLARTAGAVLRDRRRTAQVIRRARALDRRLHRQPAAGLSAAAARRRVAAGRNVCCLCGR